MVFSNVALASYVGFTKAQGFGDKVNGEIEINYNKLKNIDNKKHYL